VVGNNLAEHCNMIYNKQLNSENMIYYFIPSEITTIKYILYIKKTMLYILTYLLNCMSPILKE